MEALDDAVGLQPVDPGPFVPDDFELEEELVGVAILEKLPVSQG